MGYSSVQLEVARITVMQQPILESLGTLEDKALGCVGKQLIVLDIDKYFLHCNSQMCENKIDSPNGI